MCWSNPECCWKKGLHYSAAYHYPACNSILFWNDDVLSYFTRLSVGSNKRIVMRYFLAIRFGGNKWLRILCIWIMLRLSERHSSKIKGFCHPNWLDGISVFCWSFCGAFVFIVRFGAQYLIVNWRCPDLTAIVVALRHLMLLPQQCVYHCDTAIDAQLSEYKLTT